MRPEPGAGCESAGPARACLRADLELALHGAQVSLGLRHLVAGMAQMHLHLVEVALHLLLQPQGLVPAPDLRIQQALHGLCGPLAVSLQLLDFFILLSDPAVKLQFHLAQLQLDAQDLALFVFQGTLIKAEG